MLILIAYLLGSIQTGLWIGKLFFHTNLREHGSGNTGTTNTFRVLGKTAGTITFLVDMFKGTLAVLYLSGLCYRGFTSSHWFLCYYRTCFNLADLKAGRLWTSAGVLLGFAPLYCVFLLLVFALTLYLTSMISFSSVTAAIVGLITLAVFPAIHFLLDGYDLIFTGVLTIMALIIIFRHTENMGRIRRHQENLVPFGLNLTKQNPNK
ncbi:MAG: glycerol-3-phosphate acyltransferase [Streptococcus salivarius]